MEQDATCGEYASRTLTVMRAPSMANTPAIDSKEGPRTKPKGSRTFLCAFHPCFWGESPDKGRFFTPHPDFWGDCPDEVTLHTPWQHFGQKTSKVYKKTMLNVDFEHRLPLKQPKSGQGVSRYAIPQTEVRVVYDTRSNRHKSSCASL